MVDLPLAPMLVQRATFALRDDERFCYAIKHDGYRAVLLVDRGRVQLFSRNGNDMTARFPELRDIAHGFGRKRVVLDGEICADDGSVSAFWKLMRRSTHNPVISFVAFDLLEYRGRDLFTVPLEDRLLRLRDVTPPDWAFFSVARTFDSGEALFELAERHGLEGVIAKRRRSLYICGQRSSDWLKFKTSHAKADAPYRRKVFEGAAS